MPTFYELDKQSRDELVLKIHSAVSNAFNTNDHAALVLYFEDEIKTGFIVSDKFWWKDTFMRKQSI